MFWLANNAPQHPSQLHPPAKRRKAQDIGVAPLGRELNKATQNESRESVMQLSSTAGQPQRLQHMPTVWIVALPGHKYII